MSGGLIPYIKEHYKCGFQEEGESILCGQEGTYLCNHCGMRLCVKHVRRRKMAWSLFDVAYCPVCNGAIERGYLHG